MQIFINELSLIGQYPSQADFEKAVSSFTAIFNLINKHLQNAQMYKDSQLFLSRQAIHNEQFQTSFNRIRNKQLRLYFQGIIFNRLNPKDWRQAQFHSPDDWYECQTELVTDTSIAELAERKLQNQDLLALLINFTNSQFADLLSVIVTKNQQTSTSLDCVDNSDTLQNWIQIHLNPYNIDTSTIPPTDQQTILKDETRFKPTTIIIKGSRVYQERKTGYYWYVDSLHFGKTAHLEVFNAQGQHLGEATLQGQIDLNKKDNNKKINV